MVNPKIMCRKHLLGEHGELHKFLPSWEKKHSIKNRIGQIEPQAYKARHDELAAEMARRGYLHQSPLQQPDFSYLPLSQQAYTVNKEKSLLELLNRCQGCERRYNER